MQQDLPSPESRPPSRLVSTMGSRRRLFCCSAGRLNTADAQLPLGTEIMLAFTLLPSQTALPSRWTSGSSSSSGGGRRNTSSIAWGRQRGRPVLAVDQQVLSFVPAHRLLVSGQQQGAAAAAFTTSSSALAPAAPPGGAAASGGAAAAAAAAGLLQQQQAAPSKPPWLGCQLQVAGCTKRGFMRGGGKEQNQDRGLILERFRSDGELLLGVMDGHGTHGHLVSSYLVQHLPAVLMNKLAAAAALLLQGHTASSGSSKQQGSQQQQQQQQQEPRVPFVMVPVHSQQQHGGGAAAAAAAGAAGALHVLRPSKPVGRHKLVQPQRPPPSSGGSSAGSSWEDAAAESGSGSSGGGSAVGVPLSLVAAAPLTQQLLSDAFSETDCMLAGSGVPVLDSGSTALLVHVGHDTLTTAWVGDSRAVLGRRTHSGWAALPLSDDHKPERPDEQLRIVMNNGLVQQMQNGAGEGVGPYRVWFKELPVYPGLAMSRAFGDLPCRRIGVTAEPQLAVTSLTADDGLLIAATDGVWEYMTNEEAVAIAGACASADEAARQLVEESERRWLAVDGGGYVDDITAVVVRATPPAAASSGRWW